MAKKKTPAPQRAGTENEMAEFVALLAELSVIAPKKFAEFGEKLRAIQKRSRNTNERS